MGDEPATPFMRAWMPDRPDRCAANSARVAYACLHRTGGQKRSVVAAKGGIRESEGVRAHSSVWSAMRWLLSILPRSARSESVTDDPVAVLNALSSSCAGGRQSGGESARARSREGNGPDLFADGTQQVGALLGVS